LNLSQHADVSVSQLYGTIVDATINVAGKDTLVLEELGPGRLDTIINLAPHARLTAEFEIRFGFGSLTVNGGPGARLINNDAEVFDGTHVVINSNVLGNGSFHVTSSQSSSGILEFADSVSKGQAVSIRGDPGRGVASTLQIDQPDEFRGSVNLEPGARLDLVGLAKADSYTFENDMLSVHAGNRVIDRLRLTNDSTFAGEPHDLVVSKSGNDVWVTESGLFGPPLGSIGLPLHV
jgi:hypothetical protein